MDAACKDKAAFIFQYGTLLFEVILVGLMNSQATFQRMKDRILLRVNNVRYHVDNVVIFSGKGEEHLRHLENFFPILKANGLSLRIKNCSFMQSSVELLGHIVDKHRVHADEEKISKTK